MPTTIGAWNQHPNLLILHPRRGLLVIEVKDWKLENIRSMDRLTATLQVDDREVRKSNPLEQAKQYAFGVFRLLESDPALVGEPGTWFQGKLVIPWGYGGGPSGDSRRGRVGQDGADHGGRQRGSPLSSDWAKLASVSEIIFVIEEAPEGGYIAKAVGESIFTQAESLGLLQERVRDAVRCRFDEGKAPKMIRLHFVRDEVIAA